MKVKENARFSTGESPNGKLRVKNGELGKRSNFAILAFFIFNSLIVSAANVTWTGGGDTSAWSDGGNWEGGIAPGAGDIALIPENTNAVATTAADITFMNALQYLSSPIM